MNHARVVLAATFAAAAVAIAACSSFSEPEPDPSPDASGTTPEGGGGEGGGDDAGADGASNDAEVATDALTTGCSDKTREAYLDTPSLAACAGYWMVPGLIAPAVPTCAREAGNTGTKPKGDGCSAGDLCAAGWHVCLDRVDLAASLPAGATGPCELIRNVLGTLFYATAQPSKDVAVCVSGSQPAGGPTNDVFGCGDLGTQPDLDSCKPLNSLLSTDHQVDGWLVANATGERATVVHVGGSGGVLCCAD